MVLSFRQDRVDQADQKCNGTHRCKVEGQQCCHRCICYGQREVDVDQAEDTNKDAHDGKHISIHVLLNILHRVHFLFQIRHIIRQRAAVCAHAHKGILILECAVVRFLHRLFQLDEHQITDALLTVQMDHLFRGIRYPEKHL